MIDASVPRPAHPAVVATINSGIGRIMGGLGADPLAVDAWSQLPTVAHLSALHEMLDAAADPRIDRVVVDCGTPAQARDLLQAPSILLRLMEPALTPRVAMWRFAAEVESAPTVFEGLSEMRSELSRVHRALTSDGNVMRILATDIEDVSACRTAASTSGLLGVAAEVWLAGECMMAVEPLAVHLDQSDSADARYILDLAWDGDAARRARVGRRGDDLVVDVDGVQRWLPLPAVLLRCHAASAERTVDGLRVRFTPDPGQWRQPAGSST